MSSPERSAAVQPLEPYQRTTVPQIFAHGVSHARPEALVHRAGDGWQGLSSAEVEARVGWLAAALEERGIGEGDRVALLSENRPEWAIADYAVLGLGAIDVPIYPTLPADQIAYILRDSGARVLLVSSADQLAKAEEIRRSLPELERVVRFDAAGPAPDGTEDFTALLEAGRRRVEAGGVEPFRERAGRVEPEQVATLIYTSGTTGSPKGVMLTHANLAYMVAATRQHGSLPVSTGEVSLSFLPLSHVLQRAADYYFWDCGVTIAYAESAAHVAANLPEVRPHYMVSVPRLFEKIHARLTGAAGVKGKLARWGVRVGERAGEAMAAGRALPPGLALQYRLADRLVFSRLRERTGGRIRAMISGGAPLPAEVGKLFVAAGMPVYEGYGLTETSPVIAANRPGQLRYGSVGVPYPGVEVRIGAQDEILVRTPGLMKGYWGRPDALAEVVDDDGWFRTGDVGEVDGQGFLRITDRLKDLIVTAGGKNIAPQPIENHVAMSPYIAQAVMIGDRRAYPVMLLVPELESLGEWAREHHLDASDPAGLLAHPEVRALLEREARSRLEGLARYETPKKLEILPEELSQDAGTLTPTLKVRRRAVEERYRELIEGMYSR